MVDEEVAAVGAADGAADAGQGDGGGGRVQLRGPRPAPHLRLRHQPTWTRFVIQMYVTFLDTTNNRYSNSIH